MKAISLAIKNIGLIRDETIVLNKPLILFFGDIREGKTTILNCVRYVFGGAFPSDIIRHGQDEASIRLTLDNGFILREFYRAANGETKARPLVYICNGEPVRKPVDALAKLLNPFLLDQDFLTNKSEQARREYFVELFNVDTKALDQEAAACETMARDLRSTIRGYGDIDLTVVDYVDNAKLRDELAAVRAAHDKEASRITQENNALREHNNLVAANVDSQEAWAKHIDGLQAQLNEAREQYAKVRKWVETNHAKPLLHAPAKPDTSALESRISEAAATNVRAEQSAANRKRHETKLADEKKVAALEARQREIRKEKLAKLLALTDSCGVPGLTFTEDGDFLFEGTKSGMLSTSQLMELSSRLSSLYPEGFGLDLIDRGESLGKSIFGYVDRAKAENKTILATIVGERPATVPENVGVFVVEQGKIS